MAFARGATEAQLHGLLAEVALTPEVGGSWDRTATGVRKELAAAFGLNVAAITKAARASVAPTKKPAAKKPKAKGAGKAEGRARR